MANTIKLKDDTGAIREYRDVSVVHLPKDDAGTVFAEFREGAEKSLVTITDTNEKTITPDDDSSYISSVTVKVDATDLSSINIVKGATILGVPGRYERGGEVVPTSKKLTDTIRSNQHYTRYPSSEGVDYYNGVDLNIDIDVPSVIEEYTDVTPITSNGSKEISVTNNRYAKKVKFTVNVPTGGETPVAASPTYYTVGPQAPITPEPGTVFSSITATVAVPVIENYVYQQTITDNGTHEISIPNTPITGVGDVAQYAHKVSINVNVPTGGQHAPYIVTQPYESNGTFTVNAPTDGQGNPIYMDSVTFTINVPTGGKWPTPTVRVAGSVASTDHVAGVTKYMLYVDESKRGYIDQNGNWNPTNT